LLGQANKFLDKPSGKAERERASPARECVSKFAESKPPGHLSMSRRISFFFFFHTNFHELPINYAAQGIHDKLHGNSCLKTTPPGHLSMSRRIF
jgi:hypothetical protein